MDFLWLRAPLLLRPCAIVATRFLKSPGRYDYYSPDEISWASISKLPPTLPLRIWEEGIFREEKWGFIVIVVILFFFLEGEGGPVISCILPAHKFPIRKAEWNVSVQKVRHFGHKGKPFWRDCGRRGQWRSCYCLCWEICICMRD